MAETAASLTIGLPDAAALVVGAREAALVTPDGEIETLSMGEARRRLLRDPLIVCHAPALQRRLDVAAVRAFDVLELYAFVRPARFVLPTPRGLAAALGLEAPRDHGDEAALLCAAAAHLLGELKADAPDATETARMAFAMGRAGWPWAPAVLAALGRPGGDGKGSGFDVWNRLPEWEDGAPEPPPGNQPVSPEEARAALSNLLGPGAEERRPQADYAGQVTHAFDPRDVAGAPNVVLAEAGTGVGKTLGYIAPAGLWARRNEGAVWLSTYTRNLQGQLDRELDRLYPDPVEKRRRTVVRKGRENYLCLLNFEEAARPAIQGGGGNVVALGLVARWVRATRDGDMVGGDFPGWLGDVVAAARPTSLTDRRGECIHSACPHYRRCFIERNVRHARQAELVIANHALVMIQAAQAADARDLPTRYVFDEGHHLFDAADGIFSALLSGLETAELRRWVRGAEQGQRGGGRMRGLQRRLGDLAAGDDVAERALRDAIMAAATLPAEGWQSRLGEGQPLGPTEAFLGLVRAQVLARARDARSPHSLEAEPRPPIPGLAEAAEALDAALEKLARPLAALARAFTDRLDKDAEDLDTGSRVRLESAARGLERRAGLTLTAWRSMLKGLSQPTPPEFIDWMSIERQGGRDVDVGLHRHHVDPTRPFSEAVLERAHGVLVTSATLRDRTPGPGDDWTSAELRTGSQHLLLPARRVAVPSPFDYPARTRVLIVTDVRRDEQDEVAAAYRELFLAAGGGALGLFTAIERLRGVHRRIAPALEMAGIDLLAQHVDGMDTGTLVDIFRAERDSCLLGTDAVRDGVDVPGRALRLIVFDRVPWPRPDIIHKARKAAFGGSAYDDMLTRLKLKQAFGRLVRKDGDEGVFVMLDAMTPSRLLSAFPDGVTIARVGLAEAIAATRAFLNPGHSAT